MSNKQHSNNVHKFKQTFIKYNLYINRRDYDNKWEVVKKIPSPQYRYGDKVWKGAKTVKGKAIKPMVWVTHFVLNSRDEAINKAKEMAGVRILGKEST